MLLLREIFPSTNLLVLRAYRHTIMENYKGRMKSSFVQFAWFTTLCLKMVWSSHGFGCHGRERRKRKRREEKGKKKERIYNLKNRQRCEGRVQILYGPEYQDCKRSLK